MADFYFARLVSLVGIDTDKDFEEESFWFGRINDVRICDRIVTP